MLAIMVSTPGLSALHRDITQCPSVDDLYSLSRKRNDYGSFYERDLDNIEASQWRYGIILSREIYREYPEEISARLRITTHAYNLKGDWYETFNESKMTKRYFALIDTFVPEQDELIVKHPYKSITEKVCSYYSSVDESITATFALSFEDYSVFN